MNSKIEIQEKLDKFYQIMSGTTDEERDWHEFRTLFFCKDTSLASMKYTPEKECITKPLDVEAYILIMEDFLKKKDFFEYGFNYTINVYGSIANVHSEYEAKRKKEDKEIIKKGVNLVQLIHNGQSWKIHSMLWQDQL